MKSSCFCRFLWMLLGVVNRWSSMILVSIETLLQKKKKNLRAPSVTGRGAKECGRGGMVICE